MNVRPLVYAAGAAVLLCLPRASAVTITLSQALTYGAVGDHGGAAIGYNEWLVPKSATPLTSVVITVSIDATISSVDYNTFTVPMSDARTLDFQNSTIIYPFPIANVETSFVHQSLGPTMIPSPGHISYGTTVHLDYSRTITSPLLLSYLEGDGMWGLGVSGELLPPFIISFPAFSASANVSVAFNSATLTAPSGPSVPSAPDHGTSASLLAIALFGMFAVHRRRNLIRPTL